MTSQHQELRIVALGDSITSAATGDLPPAKRWPMLVESLLADRQEGRSVVVVNSGAGGNTSREGLARFDQDVTAHDPEIVLVEFGGNDATPDPDRAVSLDEFERNTLEMLARCTAMGARAALLTFPPLIDAQHCFATHEKFLRTGGPDGFVEQYRERTRAIARRMGTPLIDIDHALREAMRVHGEASQILPDGVHLTEAGNRTVAAVVSEGLKAMLEPAAAGAAGHAGEYLACADMRNWDIVLDAEASPAEVYAAEEFREFFGATTGIQLAIRREAAQAAHHVFIGAQAALDQSGIVVDTAPLGEEGFRVIVRRDAVAIVGGRPRGTLYGVYQFLEDRLGVRFLTCDHTHIPSAADARWPCGESGYVPPLSFRWPAYKENADRPDFAARLRVNTVTDEPRLGGKSPQQLINHSVGWLLPFEQHGAEHPEYYALVDGQRDTDTGGGGPQLCVTNPDVLELVAEKAIRHLDEHPGLRNISVSQADTQRYCRCADCEALNAREGTPAAANLAFVNAVAERIEPRYPDVKVGTLAYQYTRQVPLTIRPRPNVQIQLCSIECCSLHAIDDPTCEKNPPFCADMDAWAKVCDDIWIWNYNVNYRDYDMPYPSLRAVGANARYFARSGVKGVFMQANYNGNSGELCDLRNYLMARLLWDPSLDDRAVLEEFVRLHYGVAGPAMLCYIDWLHDNAEAKGVHPIYWVRPPDAGITPEVARGVFEHFERVMAAADSEVVRARVEKASICAYRAMIEAGEMEDAERRAIVDAYITLCRRHHMTLAGERKEAETFFAELTGAA